MQNFGHRRRYEELVEYIRLRILDGRLREGDRLPSERQLTERFGIGRSSVREAMFTLSRLGLIRLKTGARAEVVAFNPRGVVTQLSEVARTMMRSPATIMEMQQTRRIVESGLAREAALRATPAAIEAIRLALDENAAAIGDSERFMRSDVAFHYAIAAAIGNQILLAALEGLADWLFDQRRVTIRNGALQTENYRQHRDIFDAIAARDPVRAYETMDAHIQEVGRKYWMSLTDEVPKAPRKPAASRRTPRASAAGRRSSTVER